MKTVTIVYDVATFKVRRIEIDTKSKLAPDEKARTMSPSAYKQFGSHNAVVKALSLN